MSDELFEVAFAGEIADGADLEQVKAKVGAMFKADASKLAHLFSGKRVVIKKNIDQATAKKYQTALNKAGALCEVRSMSAAVAPTPPAEATPAPAPASTEAQPSPQQTAPPAATQAAAAPASRTVSASDAPDAPNTDPLGITANDISDLSVSIAPVGSQMQDEHEDVAAPQYDLSELDMAPVGSDMGEMKKEPPPPPPDTSGMSMLDE